MILPTREWLRVDEVAEYWSVSVRTVYAWVKSGKLSAVRIGGSIRIPRAAALEMTRHGTADP
jgi:excisionase family DNA binding protein